MDQQEFARLIGCSAATIASIESTRLKLSSEVALRIAAKSGASYAWLMTGDPHAPMVDSDRLPYTRESVPQPDIKREYPQENLAAMVRQRLDSGRSVEEVARLFALPRNEVLRLAGLYHPIEIANLVVSLAKVLEAAWKSGSYSYAKLRADAAVTDLKRQFGEAEIPRPTINGNPAEWGDASLRAVDANASEARKTLGAIERKAKCVAPHGGRKRAFTPKISETAPEKRKGAKSSPALRSGKKP